MRRWSRQNLIQDAGCEAARLRGRRAYPELNVARNTRRAPTRADLARGADVVIVHEWNEPALVAALGAAPARRRAIHACCSTTPTTARSAIPTAMRALRSRRLRRRARLRRGAGARSTAAGAGASASSSGTRRPTRACSARRCTRRGARALVWIGNWGDGERTAELRELPARAGRARSASRWTSTACATPSDALALLARYGARYRGWLPNHRAPEVFARHLLTVHVPRRSYATQLARHPDDPRLRGAGLRHPAGLARPGRTARGCSRPGEDYLVARDGTEMQRHLRGAAARRRICARRLAAHGLATIRARHTCAHRVDELLRSSRVAGRRATGRRADADRLLRLQPAVVLLERRGDLLPRHARAPSRRAATASPSTSRTPTTGSSTATSTRPIGRAWWSTRPPRRRCARVLAEAARRRRGGQGERRRRVRRRTARGRRPRAARPGALRIFWDVDAPATLDALRAGPGHPLRARAARATTWCSPMAAARRWCAPIPASARGAACRSTTRSTRRPTTRSPPEPRFAADLALPRQPPAGPRGARRGVLPRRRRRVCRSARFLLGGNGWARQGDAAERARDRSRRHRRPQRLQLLRRAPCSTSRATAWRRSASRRRPACSRRPGAGACLITDAWEGIELFLEPEREVLVARDGAGRGRAPRARSRPSGPARSVRRRGARVLAGHTYAQRAVSVDALLREHAFVST